MGTVNLKTASGGSVILSPANTASDVTITVPASNANMATDVSTLAQFNASGSAPVYACRAWVNFNGSGTVAIRASGNVSSITDFAVGVYGVNLTTALPDTNYALTATCTDDGVFNRAVSEQGTTTTYRTTSFFRISMWNRDGSFPDPTGVYVSIFR